MNNRLTLYDIFRILFKRKCLIFSVGGIFFSIILGKIIFFPTYEASTVVMFNLKTRPTTIERQRMDVREQMAFVYTNVSLLRSKPVLSEVVTRLSLCENKEDTILFEKEINKLRSDIVIESQTFTNIVSVRVRRSNAKEAADIANTLVGVYKKWTSSFLKEEVNYVSNFLESEVAKSNGKLMESEENLKNFLSKKGLIMTNSITSARFEDIASLYDRVAKDSAVLEVDKSRLAQLENNLNSIGFKANGLDAAKLRLLISASNTIKHYKQGITDVETKLAYYLKSFTIEHPTVKSILEQEEKMTKSMYEEMLNLANISKLEDTEVQSLLEKHLRLSSEIMTLEIAIEASNLVIKESENKKWQVRRDFLPDDETEWARLKREVDFNELLYTELKEDQGVTDMLKSTEAEEIGTVRVVSPATVPKRQKGRLSTLIFGNFIGMFVALCSALMLEYRNNSFKRPHMLEAELKVPLLGVIPYAKGNGIKNINIAKRGSCSSDRFFKIAAAMFSPKKDNKTNVIQITSSVPREGKSFVSLNLAVSTSELGHKVLLIDGNFRKPSLHSVFGVDIKFGLVDILAGDMSPVDVIKKTSHERIGLMTCGENPMRASTIFNSESISNVISKVKPAYDIVLIDSAAINLYVDPAIISSVVDGVILVIEADKTQKESVAIAKKIIEEQSKVIGTVLNKTRYYIPEFIFQSVSNLHIS